MFSFISLKRGKGEWHNKTLNLNIDNLILSLENWTDKRYHPKFLQSSYLKTLKLGHKILCGLYQFLVYRCSLTIGLNESKYMGIFKHDPKTKKCESRSWHSGNVKQDPPRYRLAIQADPSRSSCKSKCVQDLCNQVDQTSLTVWSIIK